MAVNIGVARESAAGERRVALTPETCKKLVAAGATVRIESGTRDLGQLGLQFLGFGRVVKVHGFLLRW